MRHIRIQLTTAKTTAKTKVSVPLGMTYWSKLWDGYTSEYSSVEIHCWKEEMSYIKELTPLAAYSNEQGLIRSFTITLNETNKAFLRGQSFDPEGGLKWFALFFYKNDVQMLEVAQYGSEIALYGIDKSEAEEFLKLFPNTAHSEYFEEHVI